MTKFEMATELVKMAEINNKKDEAVKRIVNGMKLQKLTERYNELKELNSKKMAAYFVMCVTGIESKVL